MATVYSYVRFSAKKQEQGDSVRRQLSMGSEWLKRHPQHTLDQTIKLRDLGVAAFRGANLDKDKGDLGKFVHLVKQPQSPIAKGSILLLERLDRFSRQPPRKAYRVFCELVEAGIVIQTLDPEQMIDESNIDNMEVVLPVIIYMQLAYEQSREKRRRVGSAWKEKRQAARDGQPMSKRCPSWLEWNEKGGKWKVKPDAKKALLYIFEQTAEGIGQRTLTHELNKRFKPIGRSGKWNGSFVQKVLSDRSVLGELQPHTFTDDGQRVPDGQPIVGYYPRVIPDDLFYRASAAKSQRVKQKGPNGKFVNLFTGLVFGSDGHPQHIQTTRAKRQKGLYIQRRFVSWGHLRGLPDACPLSVDYWTVETLVLAITNQITADQLNPPTNTNTLHNLALELQGVEERLAELSDALTSSKKPVPQLVQAISELQDRRDKIKLDIDKAKQEQATMNARPVKEAKDILETIKQTPPDEQHNMRLKLRGLFPSFVSRIVVSPFKVGRQVRTKLSVYMKDGWVREVRDSGEPNMVIQTAKDIIDILPKLRF